MTEKAKGPKSGKTIETLGWYNPHVDQKQIKTERAKHWIEHGAQASGTVYNLLIDAGVISGSKVNVLPHKQVTSTGSDDDTSADMTATHAAAEESADDTAADEEAADSAEAATESGEEATDTEAGDTTEADAAPAEEAEEQETAESEVTATEEEEKQ